VCETARGETSRQAEKRPRRHSAIGPKAVLAKKGITKTKKGHRAVILGPSSKGRGGTVQKKNQGRERNEISTRRLACGWAEPLGKKKKKEKEPTGKARKGEKSGAGVRRKVTESVHRWKKASGGERYKKDSKKG